MEKGASYLQGKPGPRGKKKAVSENKNPNRKLRGGGGGGFRLNSQGGAPANKRGGNFRPEKVYVLIGRKRYLHVREKERCAKGGGASVGKFV